MPALYRVFYIFRKFLNPLPHYKEGRSSIHLFQLIHENPVYLHIGTVIKGQCNHRLTRINITSPGENHSLCICLAFTWAFLFRTLLCRLCRAAFHTALYNGYRFFFLGFPTFFNKTKSHGKNLENNKKAKHKNKSKDDSRLFLLRLPFPPCSPPHQNPLFFFCQNSFSLYIGMYISTGFIILTSISKLFLSATQLTFIRHA